MVGYAFRWITMHDVTSMQFQYTTNYIIANFNNDSEREIRYTDRSGDTEIGFKGKEIMVGRNFTDVFCEDFELFFKNRPKKLDDLSLHYEIVWNWNFNGEQNSEEQNPRCNIARVKVINTRLLDCLENLLKSAARPPKIVSIHIDACDTSQAMRIIRSLHPRVLECINLNFERGDLDINFEDVLSLEDWNKERYLSMTISLKKLTAGNLSTIKKALYMRSTFDRFEVYYKSRDEDCDPDTIYGDFVEVSEYPPDCYIKTSDQWEYSDSESVDREINEKYFKENVKKPKKRGSKDTASLPEDWDLEMSEVEEEEGDPFLTLFSDYDYIEEVPDWMKDYTLCDWWQNERRKLDKVFRRRKRQRVLYRRYYSESDPEKENDCELLAYLPKDQRCIKIILDSDSEMEMLGYPTCFSWWELFENRDVMEIIVRNIQCFDIQCLRKTCSGVRNCLDIIKPDPHISEYLIQVKGWYGIKAEIVLSNGARKIVMERADLKEDSEPVWTAANDLYVNLQHQKTCLENLRLEFPYNSIYENSDDVSEATLLSKKLLEHLAEFLKSMKMLKVRTLSIGSVDPNEILLILPYLDAEKVAIFDADYEDRHYPCEYLNVEPNYKFPELNLKLDQISQHWSSFKKIAITNIPISTPIQEINFDNFSKVDICLKTISSEDVLFLKNKLLTSANLLRYKFSFPNAITDENLHTLIGEPYRNINEVRKIWYFRLRSTDDYMHIVLDNRYSEDKYARPNNKSIIFSKVAKEDTPFF